MASPQQYILLLFKLSRYCEKPTFVDTLWLDNILENFWHLDCKSSNS